MSNLKLFIDHYSYHEDGYLISKSTNKQVGRLNSEGYVRIRLGGKEYRAHRVIWSICHNEEIPEGMLVDHIDGNKANNKIENLRLASRVQNNANKQKVAFARELPKGVTRTGSKYRARLHHKGKTYSLGTYDSPEEAAEAYNKKAKEVHGEYAHHTKFTT